jgi:hypothetical protein
MYNPRALEEMDAIVRKYRLADKSDITNLPCPQAMADAADSTDGPLVIRHSASPWRGAR